jgi:hypothetical protein
MVKPMYISINGNGSTGSFSHSICTNMLIASQAIGQNGQMALEAACPQPVPYKFQWLHRQHFFHPEFQQVKRKK